MRRTSILSSTAAICLGYAVLASAQVPCLVGMPLLPPNTGMALGPFMHSLLITYPQLASTLLAARDAWDATEAVNRLGDWNGVVTASDCPKNQPMQIGAFNFLTTRL